jgi:hypothetical protein
MWCPECELLDNDVLMKEVNFEHAYESEKIINCYECGFEILEG